MGRQRSPDRDKAETLYIDAQGDIKLKDIAEALGLPEGTIRGWKLKDGWDDKINGVIPKALQNERNVPKKEMERSKKTERIMERSKRKITKSQENQTVHDLDLQNSELTEKQKLFCMYFIRTRNGTQAAKNAGYSPESAYVIASENLRKPHIRREIDRLMQKVTDDIYVDTVDVLTEYRKIAFSDPASILKFGQREQQVMGMYGPVFETKKMPGGKKEKVPVMETVNYVDLVDSDLVDTSVITEVSQGKNGIKIKMADKMKALEKLEKHLDMLADQHQRNIELERLEIEKEKLALMKRRYDEDDTEETDDGFINALSGEVKVWDEED